MRQVLIVDDEPELLLSIQTGFEGHDRFQILTAANGREALEILDSNKIDLVVTDLRMPEMDGVELLATMSDLFPAIPSIVMSAFGTPILEQQLKKAGTLGMLDKPLDIDALEKAINKALDSHKEQDGSLSGITIGNFIQLIGMEGKTAHIKIFHPAGSSGNLIFLEGQLLDGDCGELTGQEAVLEILGWDNVKIAVEELVSPYPDRKIKSDLMPLLLEAARLKDEKAGNTPLEEVKKEFNRIQQQETTEEQETKTGGGDMAGLKDTLKEMADEMDGVLAIQITGMDGITIAMHNPTGADVEAFSAKFAMVMKLVEKAVDSLQGMGDFEENLVQSQNAWLLTRYVTPQYYVGIAVSRDGTLGNVRLVAQRYLDQLRRSL